MSKVIVKNISDNINLNIIKTDKFKTGCFSVNFIRAHSREDAPLDALLTSVLLRGTETYPDMQRISTRLDELYGASFGTLVRRKGEVKLFGFYAVFTPVSTWLGHVAEAAGVNDYIILALTMIANFVLEFLFCKLVVYRNQENTRV